MSFKTNGDYVADEKQITFTKQTFTILAEVNADPLIGCWTVGIHSMTMMLRDQGKLDEAKTILKSLETEIEHARAMIARAEVS